MRLTICLTAAALIFGSAPIQATAKTAAFQLNKTTWTFTDKKGVKVRRVDRRGWKLHRE